MHTAHDGRTAVEACARHPPDAVLLDIGMPYLKRYDVCRSVRQLDGGRQLVVVALTG